MSTLEKKNPEKAKRIYHSPVLRRYGTIRTITESVANNSTVLDGGTKNMQKTH